MSILYSNYASDLSAHSSHVVGNVGYSMMPGNNPVLGGGSLGVSKYCKRPKDALLLLNGCAVSRFVQHRLYWEVHPHAAGPMIIMRFYITIHG